MAFIQQQLNNDVENMLCVKIQNSNLDNLTLQKICNWGIDYFKLLINKLENLDSTNKQIIIAHQSNLIQDFVKFISDIVNKHFNAHNRIDIDILITMIDKIGQILGPNYIAPNSTQCNNYLKQIQLIDNSTDMIISLRQLSEKNMKM